VDISHKNNLAGLLLEAAIEPPTSSNNTTYIQSLISTLKNSSQYSLIMVYGSCLSSS